MSKKTLVVGLVIIVILVGLGVWSYGRMQKTKAPAAQTTNTQQPAQTQESTPPLPFTVKSTSANKTPDGFVAGFPLEANAKILENSSAQTAAGLQTTRSFVSAKTSDENYKIYSDYLSKNKWKILTTVDTASFKSISATSPDGVKLNLSIALNPSTKNVEVSISFLQPNK